MHLRFGPKPIRIGSRALHWVEQEALDFVASRARGAPSGPLRNRMSDTPRDRVQGISSTGFGWTAAVCQAHDPGRSVPSASPFHYGRRIVTCYASRQPSRVSSTGRWHLPMQRRRQCGEGGDITRDITGLVHRTCAILGNR